MQTMQLPVAGASLDEGPPRSPPYEPPWRSRLRRLAFRLLSTGHERWARLATFVVVAGATVFVFIQLHPGFLFLNTEDVGGDTAAHVTAPYYMIHYLLPHGQITGWDSWWFDGFPLYVFYFPLPALFVAALSVVAPYAVAFKLVTVLGAVTLPVCCFVFGRLCGFARPVPALLAAGAVTYLFNNSYTIDGGNVTSTMAGEFSFSLSLSLMVLFLGVFIYALRTGRLRWLAPILFLLTVLSHVVPALFAAGMAVLLALAFTGTRPLRRVLLPVGVASGLLSAFWLLPFAAYVSLYSSSMNYGPVGGSLWSNIFPHTVELVIACFALLGFGFAVWHAERVMTTFGVAAIGTAVMFQWGPAGLVYNGRWLPFWFLAITFLAAYAIAELGRLAFAGLRIVSWQDLFTPLFGGAVTIALVAAWLGVLPFWNLPSSMHNQSSGWAAFNYEGYQRMPGWEEFHNVVAMLDEVGARYGCGRLDYEYTPNVSNYFGSTLVEMSFPLWTNGCIDSTEGVYFESATTTHFHFLDQSELSIDASNPVGGLDNGTQSAYENTSVVDGVKHLQLQGVTYFLANSPAIEQQADADPQLVRLTEPGGPIHPVVANPNYVDFNSTVQKAPPKAEWDVYLIKGGSTLVTPMRYDPVVENGLDVTSVANLDSPAGVALLWYQQKQYWDVPIAASGPSSWERHPLGYLASTKFTHAVVPTTVSNVLHDKSYSWISFDVGRLGRPVEVKIPYFPNWRATGATGPFLVTPNLMVVVPTSHHVRLYYGTTGVDWLGRALSLAGVGTVVAFTVHRATPPEPGSDSSDGVLTADLTESGPLPGGDLPGGDAPGGDAPGGDAPGGDPPGGDPPGGDPPGGDAPDADAPGGDLARGPELEAGDGADADATTHRDPSSGVTRGGGITEPGPATSAALSDVGVAGPAPRPRTRRPPRPRPATSPTAGQTGAPGALPDGPSGDPPAGPPGDDATGQPGPAEVPGDGATGQPGPAEG